jgi:hypothetical protein
MPYYHVTMHGNAWVQLTATVEAEDEKDAIDAALNAAKWQIFGDVERTGCTVTLKEVKDVAE